MVGLLNLLLGAALPELGAKGDRPRDKVSNRVAQAFETAAGGPQGGLSPDQALAYAKSVNPAMREPRQAPVAQAQPPAAAPAAPDPMQTASAVPSGPDAYLGWQRGMGSSEGPPQRGPSGGGGGGLNWRELLRALGPALMMADPLGRNQGMAAAMMRANDDRRQDAKTTQAQNQTKQWLLGQGMDEGTAAMMVSDPVLLRQWFGDRNKKPDPKDALELEKMQLEINKMRNPTTFRALTDEEEASRGLETSKSYQIGPDGKVDQIGGAGQTINLGGGSDKQIFDTMNESAVSARSAVNGLASLREARKAVDGGIISGAGADLNLGLQKIGAALGVTDPQTIVNTETFRSAIAPQIAAMMKATVGSTQISNADREFAEKAAGGSITLDEGSIRRLLDIMERAGNAAVSGHLDRLNKVYPEGGGFDRERALFGVEAPAMAPLSAGDPAADGWTDVGGGVRIRRKQ